MSAKEVLSFLSWSVESWRVLLLGLLKVLAGSV